MQRLLRVAGRLAFGSCLGFAPVAAQAPAVALQGHLLIHGTGLRPTPDRGTAREVYLSQPGILITVAPATGLGARVTLNGEGLTLGRGELTPGAWGEGYIDRRHPHTLVHEAVLWASARHTCAGVRCGLGLSAGKGFVPFGSDDPMSRPFAAYPVNHHLAQILERALAAAQVSLGPLLLEAALFNGDEPETPWQWPRVSRFGDSYAVRLTLMPVPGLELSGSWAEVASPESRPGTGPSQAKRHAGVRLARELGHVTVLALAEWARTSELAGVFRYESRLLEIELGVGPHRVAWRAEATDRPEEERLSAYRALRPHLDNSIIGITRWTLHTLGYRYRRPAGRAEIEPFVEATLGSVRETAGGVFDVRARYGHAAVRRVSLGARLTWDLMSHRMGRYGLAAPGHGHDRGH